MKECVIRNAEFVITQSARLEGRACGGSLQKSLNAESPLVPLVRGRLRPPKKFFNHKEHKEHKETSDAAENASLDGGSPLPQKNFLAAKIAKKFLKLLEHPPRLRVSA